jgi:hypothetical protein
MKKFQRPLDVLAEAGVLQCTFGNFPWDNWEKDALDAGVPDELASLGRATMREAYQHDWEDDLKSLCGWYDQGRRMIQLALRSPEKARTRWEQLLESDGNRGCYDPRTGEWVSFI